MTIVLERPAPLAPDAHGEGPTVLIVDDHRCYADLLSAALDAVPGIRCVGTAATAAEGIERVRELAPTVVVMDIQMPGMDGIAATRAITSESPSVGVVVLTMSEDDGTVFSAVRAGARGYLLKGADQEEVVRAITTVAGGGAVFGAALARRIAEFFTAGPAGPETAFPQLTAREREILDLIARGRNNQEIASQLYLSSKTVRNHISNICTKLQVADRTQAMMRARDAGLGRG